MHGSSKTGLAEGRHFGELLVINGNSFEFQKLKARYCWVAIAMCRARKLLVENLRGIRILPRADCPIEYDERVPKIIVCRQLLPSKQALVPGKGAAALGSLAELIYITKIRQGSVGRPFRRLSAPRKKRQSARGHLHGNLERRGNAPSARFSRWPSPTVVSATTTISDPQS